jgi:hypothetical protein
LTASISWVCGQLFSSLFSIDFHRTNFSDSAGPFTVSIRLALLFLLIYLDAVIVRLVAMFFQLSARIKQRCASPAAEVMGAGIVQCRDVLLRVYRAEIAFARP